MGPRKTTTRKATRWVVNIKNGQTETPEVHFQSPRESFTVEIKQRVKGRQQVVLHVLGDTWNKGGEETLTLQILTHKDGHPWDLRTIYEEEMNAPIGTQNSNHPADS